MPVHPGAQSFCDRSCRSVYIREVLFSPIFLTRCGASLARPIVACFQMSFQRTWDAIPRRFVKPRPLSLQRQDRGAQAGPGQQRRAWFRQRGGCGTQQEVAAGCVRFSRRAARGGRAVWRAVCCARTRSSIGRTPVTCWG